MTKLDFYEPRLDEYEKYKEYYERCIQLCSESSFWGIWDMVDILDAKRAFYKDFYWHTVMWHNEYLWMPPIGDWGEANWEELLTEVVPKGTIFGFMPEYLVKEWTNKCPGKITVISTMDSESDYLYYVNRQISLEGKAYSSMRKKINKFTASFGNRSEFRAIEPTDIPEIKKFQEWWIEENRKLGKACEDMEIEHQATMKLLDIWPLKDLKGGVLFIDEKIVGYTIFAELDTHTAEGHILKANYNYPGIYQYIIYQLYNHMLKDYAIFNAWGDGGIEGLRQTKMEQNPLIKLNKFIVRWEG